MKESYSFKTIEEKWQKIWAEQNIFHAKDKSDLPKYYVLEMFPYPSGKIHMGHVRNYSIGDVMARYKRSKGFNVLHPMGWDAFGLPAENAARENGSNPMEWTYSNIVEMKQQLAKLGFSFDWSRELVTCSADYYKHEQKIFIEFFKNNLAYKKESWVNWDPIEKTVLANEQVVDGKGWRSGAMVEQKKLSQWFLKITDFAEDLLQDLNLLSEWPEKVLTMQKNWIGKSQGAIINFPLHDKIGNIDSIAVYSTRPETIYGTSFIALSPKHSLSLEIAIKNSEIQELIKSCNSLGNIEENIAKEEKLGVFTGLYVLNPINQQKIPVFVANYVLDHGSASIFGCPAHDQRDYDFAKKYNLPIITVVKPIDAQDDFTCDDLPFEDAGILINSEILNGLLTHDAKSKIIEKLIENNLGYNKTEYRLKDWGISRQRYWGTPIPMIHCASCGSVPEKLENLPVVLPNDIDFTTSGNPLDAHPTWKHTVCPKCNQNATRETDTFDTFFESSWYFLRYPTIHSSDPFHSESLAYWGAVDRYIGGIEHAIMHLLYSRFFVKALKKVGLISSPSANFLKEPFTSLLTQGMICHKTYKTLEGQWVLPTNVIYNEKNQPTHSSTKEILVEGRSEKMSKSKKNVVDPDHICKIYGADTARLFVLSDSPPDKDLEWTDDSAEGCYKFINRFWRLAWHIIEENKAQEEVNPLDLSKENLKIYTSIQQYCLSIEKNINEFHLNKAIALSRELFNTIEQNQGTMSDNLAFYALKTLLIIFNPFIPHVCEELWSKVGTGILAEQTWCVVNEAYLESMTVVIAIQIKGKTKSTLELAKGLNQEQVYAEILKIDHINQLLRNQNIKKIIYVQDKIINIVI